jgi:hypothetical protein
MNSRLEYNQKLIPFLHRMMDEGENPCIDFVKRSDQEQGRLFSLGRDENGNIIDKKRVVTWKDGKVLISWHQFGRGCDIFFQENGMIIPPKKGWVYWHKEWEKLGGHPMIIGDEGHFEG